MTHRFACDPRKRVHALNARLPFFQALCARPDDPRAAGIVLFDPAGETPALLRRWLRYRRYAALPALADALLPAAATRDMVLRGNTPALQDFGDWAPREASTAFIADWLAWHGIIPDAESGGELASRSREWWERTAQRELDALRAPRAAPPPNATLDGLVRALARGRRARDELLEAFEALDATCLEPLAPKDFDRVRDTLERAQYPEPEALSVQRDSPADAERAVHDELVTRSANALASGTPLAPVVRGAQGVELYRAVEPGKPTLRVARDAAERRATPNNASFAQRAALSAARKLGRAAKLVPIVLLRLAAVAALSQVAGPVRALKLVQDAEKVIGRITPDRVVRNAEMLLSGRHKEVLRDLLNRAFANKARRRRNTKDAILRKLFMEAVVPAVVGL